MIAHVAQTGENRGRVVLQLGSAHPSIIALEAAVRIARAFQSEIESVFVEDEQLFDCAAYDFVREVSLTGRHSRAVSKHWCLCRLPAHAISSSCKNRRNTASSSPASGPACARKCSAPASRKTPRHDKDKSS